MRKLTKVLAGVAVAAIFTIGAALPAQAADNDFTPSPNKFREYMLNVTSKVLKGAMPDAWKREQLANQFRYNHAWETLNAQFGFSAANPDYMGAPDSYDDYMVRKAQMKLQGGTGGKPFRAPATKPSLWQKTANLGGGLMALTGFPVGAMIGTGGIDVFGGWFGFDAEGAVCGQSDGWGKDAAQLLTGRDCSMWVPPGEYLESLASKMMCVKSNSRTYTICILPVGLSFYKPTGTASKWTVYMCAVDEQIPGVLEGVTSRDPLQRAYQVVLAGSDGTTKTFTSAASYGSIWTGSQSQNGCFAGKFIHDAIDLTDVQADWFRGATLVDFYPTYKGAREEYFSKEPEGAADEYQLECEIALDDGTTLRSKGASYGSKSETLSPPVCPSVPEGRTATNVDVREQKAADPPGSGNSVSSQPTTPEYQDWSTTFPECGTGACKLDLIQKPKASCFDLEYQCADWFEDADKANKYQCRYGVKDVDLDECAVYAGLFKPGRVDTGSPYTDPETGVWSGGKNSVEESRNAMGLPVQNPAEIRACDGTSGSGSFDPIRFIMRPIQCALEWAFVPRPAVVEAELSGGDQAWDKKPPKVIAGVVSGFAATPSVSGCSRSVTIFSGQYTSTITPLNACAGSWGETAANVSKVATSAAMVVLVVVVVRRQIAGMIGYGAGQ